MICSLFNFCPQSTQSRCPGAFDGRSSPNRAPRLPKLKHYKPVEFLSIFTTSSPPAQTQRPPVENFLAKVLSLLLIHLLSTRSPILPKWNKSFKYLCSQWHGQPKILCGSKCLILGEQQYLFETLPLKAEND